MLKKFSLSNQIYIIPGYYSIAAVALSISVILLDTYYAEVLQRFVPTYYFTSIDLARTILSTLTGSLFAMITVSFSTIMVVLTVYSSQFSPRTMQDFLNSRVTLRVLGIFIGGFIYSILTLLFLRGKSDQIVFSAVIGVAVAIICLAYFVYFIHHAARSVQVNFLIEKLRDEIFEILERTVERTRENENIRNDPPSNIDDLISGKSQVVYAHENGYIQMIRDLELAALADEQDVVIRAEKMVGDYVTENSVLFSIWQSENDIKDDDWKKFLQYAVIGSERSKRHDLEFGLLKLTEVALKAISPGINDPNTAIFCINQLGMVLSEIAKSNIENTYYYNEENKLRLILEDITFNELLYKTFYQISHYGKHDVSIAGAILDSLIIVAEGSPEEIKERVWEFSSYILRGFDKSVLETEDKKFLNHKIINLARITDRRKEYEELKIKYPRIS